MRFRFALQSVGFHLTRVGVGMGLCRAGRQVLGAPLAELPGANVKLRRYLRQPLAAVQQPLHCLRLELPREAPSGSPRRHPSLLGCLGSLANPPAPGGKSTVRLPRFGGRFVGKAGELYGTTYCCGEGPGNGTVFELTPPAESGGPWTETVLHSFGNCPWLQ